MPSLHAIAWHAALGASLGLLCFASLAASDATRDLLLAVPYTTALMLALVSTSLLAVASGLTGFLFLASAERR